MEEYQSESFNECQLTHQEEALKHCQDICANKYVKKVGFASNRSDHGNHDASEFE